MEVKSDIINKAGDHIFNLFKEELSSKYVYHDYKHTFNTVEVCKEIGEYYKLSEQDFEDLIIAAWFHDAGYIKSYKGHEEQSVDMVREFLSKENYSKSRINNVTALILSTKHSQEPQNLLEEILHDADVVNVGKKDFFFRAELLRVEWELFLDKYYTNFEWEKLQLEFLLSTNFYTDYAQKEFGRRRGKNINKQRENLNKSKKKEKKTELKEEQAERPRRGTETMYRSTYRTHINLSSIADSKANMMISINTIIISIIITVVGSGFSITGSNFVEHIRFTLPIGIFLVSTLISVIFAILSARPNVTSKKVDKQKIKEKKSSVLFFGNFANMELKNFIDNMNELMKSKEMLYDNMTIDLYYLGVVLQRKYKLLRISYNVFMGGLILCVLAFVIIFIISYEPGALEGTVTGN